VEGLTDKNGEFHIETINNDDFVTILANKNGYLAGQRTYVRENEMGDSSKGSIKENRVKIITIVLIRESLIYIEKSIIMLTYSNLLGDNFSSIVLSSENSKILKLT